MEMKFICTLIFVLFLSPCVAQEPVKSDTINQKISGKEEGYWVKHRKNGEIEWEGSFKNGEKTGLWRFYDSNGKIYSEGKFLNGYKIGDWYDIDVATKTKLEMIRWDGKGHQVGGATMSW